MKKHKMEYGDFLKVILGLQQESRVVSDLYDRKVDLIEFVDQVSYNHLHSAQVDLRGERARLVPVVLLRKRLRSECLYR
jgi:hypothetical protein